MSDELILVIDDNVMNLELIYELLTGKGYEVRTAANAQEALAILRTLHPQLIFMDVQLPDIDGLTLTRRLKADPTIQDIVIIALTAYSMKGDEQKAREAGCDGYISKPIETRTFVKTMERFLQVSQEKPLL